MTGSTEGVSRKYVNYQLEAWSEKQIQKIKEKNKKIKKLKNNLKFQNAVHWIV